jgi:hypothetical protein
VCKCSSKYLLGANAADIKKRGLVTAILRFAAFFEFNLFDDFTWNSGKPDSFNLFLYSVALQISSMLTST